jgi:hypothetical protein
MVAQAHAEPLRLFVPEFVGPDKVSQRVRTTIYFEIIKALTGQGSVKKGAWIIYGQERIKEPSHSAVIEAASLPSVYADMAIWGEVSVYDDGVTVQLYLTITPILETRKQRPEQWVINTRNSNGKQLSIYLDLPGKYFEFEPIVFLSDNDIIAYEKPEGMPIYKTKDGDNPIGYAKRVVTLKEIREDAILVESDGKTGWIRIVDVADTGNEAIPFAKGVVCLLRGDWSGALESFKSVLQNSNIPQDIRNYSLMYSGLAKEQMGKSGNQEFEAAYTSNPLDSNAASYLLMAHIAEVERARKAKKFKRAKAEMLKLKTKMNQMKPLFDTDSTWFHEVKSYAKQ